MNVLGGKHRLGLFFPVNIAEPIALVKRASGRHKTAEFATNVLWKVFSQTQRSLIQEGPPTNCKMSEFFEKSPLSGAGKHPDFQVTSCYHFVSTNVDFAYIKSE